MPAIGPCAEAFDAAVRWLVRRRRSYDPLDTPAAVDPFRLRSLAELSLLAHQHRRYGDDGEDLRRFLAFAEQVGSDPRYLAAVRTHPWHLPLFANHCAALLGCGMSGDALRDAIKEVASDGYATAIELPPTGTMSLRYALDACGLDHDLPALAQTYPATLLAKRPDPGALLPIDAYLATHAAWYATDYGLRPDHMLAADERRAAGDYLLRITEEFLRRGNLDVVAEAIFAAQCLGAHDPSIESRAWSALQSAIAHDGSLAPPPDAVAQGQIGSPEDRRWHATFVFAMAALASNTRTASASAPGGE